MPAISVIIPTYNRAGFLSRAIRSVVAQTLPCAEILIVDDGSTDDTARLVEQLQKESSIPLRYFWQENSGPAAARNLGVDRAAGSLLAFLDSDDHWHREKLECQWSVLQHHPHILVAHTREKWLRRGLHLNQKNRHLAPTGHIFSLCLQLCAVGMSTVMVRRELFAVIGLFDPTFPCCEDYDFWLRASCRFPFLLVDRPLTIKEGGRADQVSVQYRVGMDRYRIRAMSNLLASSILNDEQRVQTCAELRKKCRVYGQGCIKHGRPAEGEAYLRLADEYEN